MNPDTFADGAAAYRAGLGLAANPHRGPQADEWRRGWLSAESRQLQSGVFNALRMTDRKGPKRYREARTDH